MVSNKMIITGIMIFTLSFFIACQPSNESKKKTTPSSKSNGIMMTQKMMGISGREYSLKEIKKENGLLLIFSCNTCPFVLGWEDRYPAITALAYKYKIGMVLINSNNAQRNDKDSLEAMKAHAADKYYGDIPYVVDENSVLAKTLKATRTPEVFLFDKTMNIIYQGAIDDNMESAKAVKNPWLNSAIKALGTGKRITTPKTKSIGCSIKF